MHTWIGELQSSAHSRSWLRGSWSEEADGAGSRRRTEVPRGKRMRSPGGYETHRDAPAGVDAQRRRRQAPALSLRSLSPLFFAGCLSARSLSFSLCCCFYLCLLRKGANPSRALLSFPRRIPLTRALFPAQASLFPRRPRVRSRAQPIDD